jgi:hypothetical protein
VADRSTDVRGQTLPRRLEARPLTPAARRSVDITSDVNRSGALSSTLELPPVEAGKSKRRGQSSRRLILLISVGWLPPYLFPPCALPRSRHEGWPKLPANAVEGCVKPGPRLSLIPAAAFLLPAHAVSGACFAIDHMNANISRAIAVITTLGCLPLLISRRYRLQSLNCAFHAIA